MFLGRHLFLFSLTVILPAGFLYGEDVRADGVNFKNLGFVFVDVKANFHCYG